MLIKSRRVLKGIFRIVFPKCTVPKDLQEIITTFDIEPSPLVEYARTPKKIAAEILMGLAMVQGTTVDCEKVRSSLPIDKSGKPVDLRPLFKAAKKISKTLLDLIELAENAPTKSAGAGTSTAPIAPAIDAANA